MYAKGRKYLLTAVIISLFPILSVAEALEAFSRGVDESQFVLFETGQVRPITLSADGNRLLVLNTPNNSLEIYTIYPKYWPSPRADQAQDDAQALLKHKRTKLKHVASVPVGLEPIAVAARNENEVWVVNHLSDSVSIVDLSENNPRVVRTLLVGDEPRDIVFAGVNRDRAFITTAHRGQNVKYDPQYFQSGIGRADVWVFDANNLGETLEGEPLKVLQLFGDTPRALAVTPDGGTVYAAVFFSGNQSTIIGASNLPKAEPNASADGVPAPDTSLIVKYDGEKWVDETGSDLSEWINVELPDYDVFAIDANANPPAQKNVFSGVGTTLFNMVVNPASGALYVSNTEALNHIRFDGEPYPGRTSVKSHFVENRITVINEQGVLPRHINKHIDYSNTEGNPLERELSLATPTDMAVSADGKTLYFTAFGSSKVGVIRTNALERDTHTSHLNQHIRVSGGGPSGLALDEKRGVLFVLTRFDNAIVTVDLRSNRQVSKVRMYNPEPRSVVEGRRFLYDAKLTSGHGDAACSSCHVFGDYDALSWDLGNPDGVVKPNPNPYVDFELAFERVAEFHPLKGPMATQSLRGLAGSGPMHWRGDRTGANRAPGESLEAAAFKEFNEAFVGLMGRSEPLPEAQMQKFTDFALQIFYPPNPNRFLDNTLSDFAAAGRALYMDKPHDVFTGADGAPTKSCNDCHVLDPANGRFGTTGLMVATGTGQDMKVPHFRNYYQKLGKFGISGNGMVSEWEGPQVRGFGVNHEGAGDIRQVMWQALQGIFHFEPVDLPIGLPPSLVGAAQSNDFLLAYPSNLAPVVGQQTTLSVSNAPAVNERIDLFVARAKVTAPLEECDLVVKGRIDGYPRGWLMLENGLFQSDARRERISLESLKALAKVPGQELTFTCVPPGTGVRIGIDNNGNGIYDFDERVRRKKS